MTDNEFTTTINAHHLTNPPPEKSASLVNFRFVNLNHLQVRDLSDDLHTEWEIVIPNPSQIYFKGSDYNQVKSEVANLILAANLTLKRACVTLGRSSFSDIRINLKPIPNSSTSRIIKKGKVTNVIMNESLSLKDYISVAVKGNETFDEKEVLSIFKKLQDFDVFGSSHISNNAIIQNTNIRNALDEFTRAMEPVDKLSKFKHLYNSLEFIVNFDGKDRTGPDFTKEVKNLTNESAVTLGLWHDLYRRSKHPGKIPTHVKTFKQGKEELSNILPDLKKHCSEIMLTRL